MFYDAISAAWPIRDACTITVKSAAGHGAGEVAKIETQEMNILLANKPT